MRKIDGFMRTSTSKNNRMIRIIYLRLWEA